MSQSAWLRLRLGRWETAVAVTCGAYGWTFVCTGRFYNSGVSSAGGGCRNARCTIPATLATTISHVVEEAMKEPDRSNTSLREAASKTWDAIVIGAGPS